MWFGGFFGGHLHQVTARLALKPSATASLELAGERNVGSIPAGDFTKDLVSARLRINFSPDLQLSGFVQYDNESESVGANSRVRWTFHPLGDLFVVYNHDVSEWLNQWQLESNQLLVKLQYALRM